MDAHDRARCLVAGMNDFVTKPIVPEQFFACLESRMVEAGGDEFEGRTAAS